MDDWVEADGRVEGWVKFGSFGRGKTRSGLSCCSANNILKTSVTHHCESVVIYGFASESAPASIRPDRLPQVRDAADPMFD